MSDLWCDWEILVQRPKVPSDSIWVDTGTVEGDAEARRLLGAMELGHVVTNKPYEAGLVVTVCGQSAVWGIEDELDVNGRVLVWRDEATPEGKFLVFVPDPITDKRGFIDAAYRLQSYYHTATDVMDWVGEGGCMVRECRGVAWWLDERGVVFCKGHQPSRVRPYKRARRRK